MSQENLESQDVSDSPEVLQLAEEIWNTGKPRVLRRHEKDLAMIVPLSSPPRQHRQKNSLKLHKKTPDDYAAFRTAAGSWQGLVDADQLLSSIYASRALSTRAAPQL